MIRLKKVIRFLFAYDEDITLEHRLFLSSTLIGLLASMLGAVINFILYTSIPAIIAPLVLSLLLVVIYYFLRMKRKIEPFIFPMNITAIVGISIIWVTNGGINGSNIMPALVILIIALVTVANKKKKYILLLFFAVFITVYLIQLFRPELITTLPSETNCWLDSLITLLYSSFFIYLLVLFIHKSYYLEKRKTKDSEEKYHTIFENVQDVFYQIDLNGNIMEISPSVKHFADTDRNDILNTSITSLFLNPDDAIKLMAQLHDRKDVRDQEIKLKSKGGSTKYASINARLLFDENGNPSRIEGTIRDISQRKKTEIKLLKAKERAEESDRLKTAFLQNLSHEVRTPMNSIMGFASLLPGEVDKNLIDKYSDIIVNNSEQLVHIIDDILLYSQLQSRQLSIFPKEFNIQDLLFGIKNSFDIPDYQKGVKFLIETYSNDPILIKTDYEKIWQIYTNLISNAYKYTNEGTITFGVKMNGNAHLFFVRDTGMGIPNNEVALIFDRFYRGSNVNKGVIGGTGLGLSIVKELIEMFGGKIWVESEVGAGSTFYFIIPLNI
jgi:PAS domain S-box-containing protein